MQKCEFCGKEIYYIALRNGLTIKCDDKLETIYTEQGRKVEGYKIHSCEDKNGKSKEISYRS